MGESLGARVAGGSVDGAGLLVEEPAQPPLAVREVDQVRRRGEVRVAREERAVDVVVQLPRAVDGAALVDRSPDAGSQGSTRQVLDKRGERRVAARADDDAMELQVAVDERLRRLRRVHSFEAVRERLQL